MSVVFPPELVVVSSNVTTMGSLVSGGSLSEGVCL